MRLSSYPGMDTKKINLNLLIDKEKNRVVYAESDEDFVDVLLSFLSLPMGSIIKLANKQSRIGSMDTLYESVEILDVKYFQTKACKSMLLSPRKECWAKNILCRDSPLTIDNGHRAFYICPNWTCTTKTHRFISMFKNVKCPCGNIMTRKAVLGPVSTHEVFVKGKRRFVIGDNLVVTPVSTSASLSFLSQLGITDSKSLEEMNIALGREEVVHLLNRSLISKTPMTDVFVKKHEEEPKDPVFPVKLEPLKTNDFGCKRISLKLLLSKSKNKVLYAEAKEDFLDLLLSFLTFPLGSIINKLEGCSSMGCVDDLYKCVLPLCNNHNAILEKRIELLLKPNIAFHYGIKDQLLKFDESHPLKLSIMSCSACYSEKKESCSHGMGEVTVSLVNPKNLNTTTESGGGYAKGPYTFMVTDNLVVQPFSAISSMTVVKNSGVPFSDLEEKIVTVGEHEALSLLTGSLTSKKVLTQTFCQKKRKQV